MRDEELSGLCCCEYYNNQGEKSHLLALCCDCQALDSAVDSLVSGSDVKSDTVREILDVVEERMRIPWRGGAVKMPLSSILPVILIPSLLWMASLHFTLAGLVFLFILPSLFLIAVRVIVKHKPKTKFFYNWSCVTVLYLFFIYEVKCVGTFWDLPKLISWWENLALVLGMGGSLASYLKLKWDFGDSKETEGKICRICEIHVKGKDHHCVWLDMCVSTSNINLFMVFLTLTILTSGHLSMMLTSYACPGTLLGPILLPSMCWPEKQTDCLLLVSGVYSGSISAILSLLLIGQACRKLKNI